MAAKKSDQASDRYRRGESEVIEQLIIVGLFWLYSRKRQRMAESLGSVTRCLNDASSDTRTIRECSMGLAAAKGTVEARKKIVWYLIIMYNRFRTDEDVTRRQKTQIIGVLGDGHNRFEVQT
ncbi:hypothetical protein HNY73_013595 [Argiope bruennichi]|uniref:Uncharacterized protein n=1 Tax=Argiope bruennichi TaxID=94029 RepID=A0A8T0F0P1_ARGBR|nr:hypothetical protein HNY73_013595 [Argiope bruennichi]